MAAYLNATNTSIVYSIEWPLYDFANGVTVTDYFMFLVEYDCNTTLP